MAIAAAAGPPTCEWMSMVVDCGRDSRPRFFCLRAAVGPYRLVSVTFLFSCHSEYAKVLGYHGRVRSRFRGSTLKHHRAGIHDHDIVGKVERELDVLFHQYDGKSL